MTHTRRDIISGIVMAGIAALLLAYTSGFPVREGRPAALSPGFYPRILAILLGIFSLIQLTEAGIKEFKLHRKEGTKSAIMQPIWKDRTSFLLFSLTLAVLILYPLAMQAFGFGITGFLFLGTLIYALSRGKRSGKSLGLILLLTAGITLATFLIFVAFLKIPFPAGLFAG